MLVEIDEDFIKNTAFAMSKDYIHKSLIDDIKAEIETDMSWFCFDDWGNEKTEWIEIKSIIDKHIGGKK